MVSFKPALVGFALMDATVTASVTIIGEFCLPVVSVECALSVGFPSTSALLVGTKFVWVVLGVLGEACLLPFCILGVILSVILWVIGTPLSGVFWVIGTPLCEVRILTDLTMRRQPATLAFILIKLR